MSINIDIEYIKRIEDENKQLKDELKEANSDVGIFIEEKQVHEQRITNLISENKELKDRCIYWENEHDELLEENQKLKQELFNVYKSK